MIQLYKKGNENFEWNGDHTLHPLSCILDRTLNGAWELSMEIQLDENGIFKEITAEAIIKAPTPEGDRLFYIYDTEKISDDCIAASARPVFLNAADDAFLLDVRPTNKTGQQALDIMMSGTRYSGTTNITTAKTAYYIRKNLIEAIASDDEQSFLMRWGGEILYNDFNIIINDRVGGDYGAKILYGKNISSISERVNIESVVTRIIPVAYNGYTLEGNTPWVDSEKINLYSHVKTRVIKYDDVKLTEDASGDEEGFETLAQLQEELIRRCNLEYENGIDKPKITLEIDLIDLADTIEYRDYSILETVSLGDTVHCMHSVLGIDTDARVIRQKWDCLLKRNTQLTLGDYQYDYFRNVSGVINSITKNLNPDGTIIADRVSGILNGIYTQLRLQSTVAQKVEGRAFTIEDLDPESPLYGCMQFGTQGLQISVTRTADGKDWDWSTAMTAKGIVANAIITGLLSDQTGSNYWNLDTGDFRLSSSVFRVDGSTLQEFVAAHTGEAEALTHEMVFNLLTNNGEIKGIYKEGNQLYISFSYAKGGTLVLGGANNVNGTLELRDVNGNVTATLSNLGISITSAAFNAVTVNDRIVVYSPDKAYNASIGFEAGTATLYIRGTGVTIALPTVIMDKATVGELICSGAFNGVSAIFSGEVSADTVRATRQMVTENLSCTGNATFTGAATMKSLEVGGKITSYGEVSAQTDVKAGDVSLVNHTHRGVFGTNHSAVMNYVTGSGSYFLPKLVDGMTADSGMVYLGGTNNKWKALYATDGTIQTSDEHEKNIEGELDERHLQLLRKLKPILYRWKKGDKTLHAGFGARATEAAMRECGIDDKEQFCVTSEDNQYSMIHTEIIPLITAGVQELFERMEAIERRQASEDTDH